MAIDYGLDDDFGFAPEDAAQMGGVLMAKITTVTEEIPQDYSGVKTKTKTVEEVPLLPPMQGPAPMMMATPAPDIGAMPGPAMANSGMPPGMPPGMVPGMAPGMASGAQMMPPQPGAPMQGMQPMPGAGSMGAQAAQQVMQQFGMA
jgi:hypothetical protein